MDRLLDAIFPLSPQLVVGAIMVVLMVHVVLGTVPLLIYLERKISAYIQDRIGPNRCGFDFGLPMLEKLFRGFKFWGLGQSLADGLKFFLKEDYMPRGADKVLFSLAPAAAVMAALIGWAVIPWGGHLAVPAIELGGRELVSAGTVLVAAADVNIGFVYMLAIASLGVYGVTLGGWASNNKFSFLGGLRASAGMISYEVPMGLSILAVLLTAGTVRPSVLVEGQISAFPAGGWLVLAQPLACLLFFTCALAEANRAPFDNAEAEQELVGGYHTEYSSMRFALFFLAEYAHMITSSAFLVVLFFGGYHLPFVALTHPEATGILAVLVKIGVFYGKVMLVLCFMMLVRWTLPRVRYDQVLKLCWSALIPIALAIVVATSVMVYMGWTATWQMLLMNAILTVVIVAVAPLMPKQEVNKRLPLAGSRFSPLPGERVLTGAGAGGGIHVTDDPFSSASSAPVIPGR